mgnify:FL=1
MAPVTESAELVVDPQLAAAVELAREVLAQDIPNDAIGEHLEVVAEAELVATHLFACNNPGYVGWRWAVNVTRVPDSDVVTVNETVLLPGNGSLLSPQWLPWDERVEAGDLGVGDVLPTAPDDPRLLPGYTGADLDDTEDDDLKPLGWELGLGRVRVLSVEGREAAADRWAAGDNGPDSPIAKSATDQCSTCGFLIAMTGPLGRAFGLCANEFSPSDGSVVSLDHGCGAHSEAEPEPPPIVVIDLVVDDLSPDGLDTEELTDAELEAPDEALIDSIEDEAAELVAAVSDESADAEADAVEAEAVEAEAVVAEAVVAELTDEAVAGTDGAPLVVDEAEAAPSPTVAVDEAEAPATTDESNETSNDGVETTT